MTSHRKQQTRDVGRENGKDKQPADDLDSDAGSPTPDTAAPIPQ